MQSQYIWRGLTRTGRPAFQASSVVGFPVVGGYITWEWWGSWEPWFAGPTDLSDLAQGTAGLAERDLSVRAEIPAGPLVFSGGWVRYWFNASAQHPDGRRRGNTGEVFAGVQWRLRPWLSPAVSVWHDYDAVEGAYVETSLAGWLPVASLGLETSLLVRLTAGWSVSQGSTIARAGNFARNGLTAVALDPTLVVKGGHALRLLVAAWLPDVDLLVGLPRYQRNVDPFTQVVGRGPSATAARDSWRAFAISLVVRYGGPR